MFVFENRTPSILHTLCLLTLGCIQIRTHMSLCNVKKLAFFDIDQSIGWEYTARANWIT